MAKDGTKKLSIDKIFTQKLKKSINPSYYDTVVKGIFHGVNSGKFKIG